MYESHWGLNARPFDHRADGAFYYPAEGHQAALVKLRYALEHGCGAALAGAAGTGKTLLLGSLERQLVERSYVFIRLVYPRLSAGELLGYLADELAEQPVAACNARPVDQCLRRVETELKRLTSQQKRVVIAVDEAHSIKDPDTFETLRLLLSLDALCRRSVPRKPRPILHTAYKLRAGQASCSTRRLLKRFMP
jgi:MSHA biogenesis protein MshM